MSLEVEKIPKETVKMRKVLTKGKIHICTRHGICKDILYDDDLSGIFIQDEESGTILNLTNTNNEKWRKRNYGIEEIKLKHLRGK